MIQCLTPQIKRSEVPYKIYLESNHAKFLQLSLFDVKSKLEERIARYLT